MPITINNKRGGQMKHTFEKHKYVIRCKCGNEVHRNDDKLITDCTLVTLDWCHKCCPECVGWARDTYYNVEGERIYV